MPLHAEAHDALRRWYAPRPPAANDALFVSCANDAARRTRLSASAVGDVVAKHAAGAADTRQFKSLRQLAEQGINPLRRI